MNRRPESQKIQKLLNNDISNFELKFTDAPFDKYNKTYNVAFEKTTAAGTVHPQRRRLPVEEFNTYDFKWRTSTRTTSSGRRLSDDITDHRTLYKQAIRTDGQKKIEIKTMTRPTTPAPPAQPSTPMGQARPSTPMGQVPGTPTGTPPGAPTGAPPGTSTGAPTGAPPGAQLCAPTGNNAVADFRKISTPRYKQGDDISLSLEIMRKLVRLLPRMTTQLVLSYLTSNEALQSDLVSMTEEHLADFDLFEKEMLKRHSKDIMTLSIEYEKMRQRSDESYVAYQQRLVRKWKAVRRWGPNSGEIQPEDGKLIIAKFIRTLEDSRVSICLGQKANLTLDNLALEANRMAAAYEMASGQSRQLNFMDEMDSQ